MHCLDVDLSAITSNVCSYSKNGVRCWLYGVRISEDSTMQAGAHRDTEYKVVVSLGCVMSVVGTPGTFGTNNFESLVIQTKAGVCRTPRIRAADTLGGAPVGVAVESALPITA